MECPCLVFGSSHTGLFVGAAKNLIDKIKLTEEEREVDLKKKTKEEIYS